MIYYKFTKFCLPIYESDAKTIDSYEHMVWKTCCYSHDKLEDDISREIESIECLDGIYHYSQILAFNSYDEMKASVDVMYINWI